MKRSPPFYNLIYTSRKIPYVVNIELLMDNMPLIYTILNSHNLKSLRQYIN